MGKGGDALTSSQVKPMQLVCGLTFQRLLNLAVLLKSPGERSKHPIARPRRWQQVGVGGDEG